MTAVANPPNFSNLNRPGWINGGQTLNSISADDHRGNNMFNRKTIQRTTLIVGVIDGIQLVDLDGDFQCSDQRERHARQRGLERVLEWDAEEAAADEAMAKWEARRRDWSSLALLQTALPYPTARMAGRWCLGADFLPNRTR